MIVITHRPNSISNHHHPILSVGARTRTGIREFDSLLPVRAGGPGGRRGPDLSRRRHVIVAGGSRKVHRRSGFSFLRWVGRRLPSPFVPRVSPPRPRPLFVSLTLPSLPPSLHSSIRYFCFPLQPLSSPTPLSLSDAPSFLPFFIRLPPLLLSLSLPSPIHRH